MRIPFGLAAFLSLVMAACVFESEKKTENPPMMIVSPGLDARISGQADLKVVIRTHLMKDGNNFFQMLLNDSLIADKAFPRENIRVMPLVYVEGTPDSQKIYSDTTVEFTETIPAKLLKGYSFNPSHMRLEIFFRPKPCQPGTALPLCGTTGYATNLYLKD